MDVLLVVFIFVGGSFFLLKFAWHKLANKDFVAEKNLPKLLLGWILLGFLTRWDYTNAWGCIIEAEPILDIKNIIFSFSSFSLALFAVLSKNRRLSKLLFFSEFSWWTLRLFVFKAGYVVGYDGGPDVLIVFYDLISILIRLFILNQILRKSDLSLTKIGLSAFFILTFKIMVIATPISFIFDMYQEKKMAIKIRSEIIGNWKGEYETTKDYKLISKEHVKVEIDSSYINLNKVQGLSDRYRFELKGPNYGELFLEGKSDEFTVIISKQNKDSLRMNIRGDWKSYELKLTKAIKNKEQ